MNLNLSAETISRKLAAACQRLPADTDGRPLPAGQALTCAAVLVPLFHWQNGWHLLLTRRAATLEEHSGQVAFPGGACEPQDATPQDTALREAREEIGLNPAHVHILGEMRPTVTITNYHVTPVVAQIPWPYGFQVSLREVDRLFSVPLDWLADRSHAYAFRHMDSQRDVIVYQPYNGELLWGASARITWRLINILTDLPQ